MAPEARPAGWSRAAAVGPLSELGRQSPAPSPDLITGWWLRHSGPLGLCLY
jgi:hypothetical protein